MQNKGKKLISVIAALALTFSAVAMAGCDNGSYTRDALGGNIAGEVVSNGGSVVEKGDYVYFINGGQVYTADNTFGEVLKGSLMRISKSDLAAGNYQNCDVVVPLLISAQNKTSGFYIYGDYVYFATPTSDKFLKGEVANEWLDFKRAKLDGSETMKDYYFRLETNSVKFRYVEENGTVYCMYVEGKSLKSYNTATGVTHTLVKDAASDYFFNSEDLTDSTVYYTMNLTNRTGTEHESDKLDYNQVYTVSASATATANADKCEYTVAGGKTYSGFDKEYLEETNDGFDASDYKTYPYVNLGTLVLDGVGTDARYSKTQYNDADDYANGTREVPNGYQYNIQLVDNGGVYFSRVEATVKAPTTPLFFLDEDDYTASAWNTINGNAGLEKVAKSTENASKTAYFLRDTDGNHSYFYVKDTNLVYAKAAADGSVASSVTLSESASGATFIKTQGNYLFYNMAGTNGHFIYRVNYTGTADNYHPLLVDTDANKEYKAEQILDLDWNNSWFTPELIDNALYFANTQSVNNTAYNYVYVFKMNGSNTDGSMTTAELSAINKKYTDVKDYIKETADEDAEVENVLRYYYTTGEKTLYENVKDEYKDKQKTKIDAFFAYDGEHKDYMFQSYFYNLVGKVNAEDKAAIEAGWAETLVKKAATADEEKGLPTWAIVLISVGGGLLVAAAVAVPVIICVKKKKKAAQDIEKTRVRKHIDTTDDRTIDVYASDEETAQEVQESSDEGSEEQTQPVDETPVESEE